MLDREDREGRKGGRTAQALSAPQSLAASVSTLHTGNEGDARSAAFTPAQRNELQANGIRAKTEGIWESSITPGQRDEDKEMNSI